MTKSFKAAAARLMFSLLALSTLGGCAVYGPAPGPYTYYGTDVDGQTVYAAPPVVYPAAPVYAAPYYYGPTYVGPPIGLSLGFGYWRGGGGRSGWHGGGRGGGFHGRGGRR
ncbi:hypothetical protein [Alicycliphilus denitrificans]|uniref:hypothetical protein n=1 Tax=Alicycliphilus denitrificans TaxID=179636 RepID=UPI003850964C